MENKNRITKDEFMETSFYNTFKEFAMNQGLYTCVVEYAKKEPYVKDAGLYLVTTPEEFCAQDIIKNPCYIEELIQQKKDGGYNFFNPYYVFTNVTYFNDTNQFNTIMNFINDVNTQAGFVNACYEMGYSKLPTTMYKSSSWEIGKLNLKRKDTCIPPKVRKRYEKSYKKFVTYVYQKYMKLSADRLKPQRGPQKVSKNYFLKHHIDTYNFRLTDYDVRRWFETEIKNYPDFRYHIEEKPAFQLKDISHVLDNTGEYNFLSNEKEVTEWNIIFPEVEKETFFKIILDWNTQGLNQEKKLARVGDYEEIATIRIAYRDIWNWDSLCTANNVKYYINHGEFEHLNVNTIEDIKVAINRNDYPMVKAILTRIANERINVPTLTAEEAANNQKNITHWNGRNGRNPGIPYKEDLLIDR